MRALLAAAALLMGCPTAAPPASDPTPAPPAPLPSDAPGPYPVSATTLEGVDDRGKWIVTEVWYPAAPEDGAAFEPYPGLNLGEDAFRDAPWDLRGGPYPVVAFSHGYGGIRFQCSSLETIVKILQAIAEKFVAEKLVKKVFLKAEYSATQVFSFNKPSLFLMRRNE